MIYKNSNLWLNYLGFEGMKSLCSYDIRLLRDRRLLHKSNNEKYDSRVCCELQRHVRKANHMLITPNGSQNNQNWLILRTVPSYI